MSFYKFKLVWTRPKWFGPDQKQLFTTEFHILKHVQNVWSCPKEFGQVQMSFGPIEGHDRRKKTELDSCILIVPSFESSENYLWAK